MFGKIKDWFVKKFLLKGIIKGLDKLLAKLPQNDAKTVTGLLIAGMGFLLDKVPQSSEYAQPILDHLHSLPAEEIVGGGLLWAIVGLAHKLIKFFANKLPEVK